jgi:hypothetical protein
MPRQQSQAHPTRTTADLLALVQQQQKQLRALTAELHPQSKKVGSSRVRTRTAKKVLPEEFPLQADVQTNYVATGPVPLGFQNIGFTVKSGTMFQTGVRGVGGGNTLEEILASVGVVGFTAAGFNDIAGGTGVKGLSSGGTGVVGSSSGKTGIGVVGLNTKSDGSLGDGDGVVGMSDGGVGVYGFSQTSVGVYGVSPTSIGVDGFGGVYGVMGAGDTAGVHGSGGNGVVGLGTFVGPDDRDPGTGYGGWFSGGAAAIHLEPSKDASPPPSGQTGDLFVDNSGALWFCTKGGDTATWKKVQLA